MKKSLENNETTSPLSDDIHRDAETVSTTSTSDDNIETTSSSRSNDDNDVKAISPATANDHVVKESLSNKKKALINGNESMSKFS